MAHKKKTQAKKTVYKKIGKKEKPKVEITPEPQQPAKTFVDITKAKGRPMLQWVGKKPLERITAFPAQHIETFNPSTVSFPNASIGNLNQEKDSRFRGNDKGVWSDWPSTYSQSGLLFHGDNKEVLAHLLANGFRGKVNLIYIDPPFDSGADYVRKVSLRGMKEVGKFDNQPYSLGEQVQYSDIWGNDNYLQFMFERLLLLKELLAENGSIYLHTDWHKSHLLRCLMDEVFGSGGEDGSSPGYKGEIVWCYKTRQFSKQYWNRKHQAVLFYSKGIEWTYNWASVLNKYTEATIKKYKYEDDIGKYRLSGRGIKDSPIRSAKDVDPKWEIEHPEWVVRDYLKNGYPPEDWMHIDIENQASSDRQNFEYPTMKPTELLRRIIRASSNEGDLVLDCFAGSGTTLAIAQKLGRRWIGCDINKGSIQTTSKRIQSIISDQIEKETERLQQGMLDLGESEEEEQNIIPTQFSFYVYRVNDYDLQIQHNEAVNLACEHIGITRTKTDSFFDGTLGKKLVKIVQFNHPCTQLDLEQIKQELKARPEETRDVTVVSLGKETAVDNWLDSWNKLRKAKEFPNKIALIELRTDQKYGKFIEHKPASARVSMKREGDKIKIVIDDFISPTIIERLSQQNGVLQPRIEDWRSMVDCVMIDPNYNGNVFNIAMSDVPEKKNDFVVGAYELPAPKGKTKVAVKIIDMLGEEVLEVKEV